jgi:gluconokinase
MYHPKKKYFKIVLIGISGSGKTTLGKILFKYFKIPFIEGDTFHSVTSKLKMQKGTPLNKQDRIIWHNRIQKRIDLSKNWVLSCSALGRWQRQFLNKKNKNICFLHCRCEKNIIKKRLALRAGHFFFLRPVRESN